MANRFWVGGSGTWDASTTTHWASASNGAGGASVPGSADTVTFDASSGGGTVTLAYDPTIVSITMGAFTGTLDMSTFSPTMATFNCSGTGVRTLTMTNMGTLTLTGNAATIWSCGTTTNLTLNPGGTIKCTYSGATGTRTFACGNISPATTIWVSAGSDIFSPSSFMCTNLDFTGYTGALANAVMSIGGSLTLGSGMTRTSGSALTTFTATTSKTVAMNGVQFNGPWTFNGAGGTWTLQDNLDLTGASSFALTLTNGTLVSNGHSIKSGSFALGAGTKGLTLSGTDTYTITGTGTAWNASGNSAGFTLTPNSSTIKMTDSSNTALTFAGGGFTYANVWFARGASTASNTISGSNTFADFKDDGTVAHSILFTAATNQHVTTFSVSGASGNLVTLNSTTTGTYTLTKDGGGRILRDYLSIQHCIATPGSTWYAGLNSTNNQAIVTAGNGWIFTLPPPQSSFFSFM